MGMERCGRFMKWSLFGFNFLMLVAGCVLLGVGIFTRANDSGLSVISKILGNTLYSTFSLSLIIFGCLVIVISFFGCCGAIKEVRCMLGAFFVLLIIIFTALLIGGIIAYAFRNDLSQFAKRKMYSSLNSSYGMSNSEPVTAAWDSLQQLFKCCGVEGSINSSTSWAYYKLHTNWYHNHRDFPQYVPKSCCKNATFFHKCVGSDRNEKISPFRGPPTYYHQLNDQLYTRGCYTAVVRFIQDNAIIIGSVALAIAVIMIIGMVFSLCLCRAIREEYELGETYCPPP